MSSQFITRVLNYVANEVIIKGLANSKTFQKVAVRADHQIRQFQKAGEGKVNQTLEDFSQQQAQNGAASGPPRAPSTGFPGFVSAFFKEIGKDLGLTK
mmetsp:Transcript_7586/g.9921  ORF Transcript_7586/g.9921 Transcript_7586/m.9921 type:complete len:98 (-) Transcript_7586:1369-1662(-)